MTSYTLIYNPIAGHNRAAATAKRVAAALRNAGHPVLLRPTTGPDAARTLSFTADSDVVVAMGGDGTINQVVGGLLNRRHPPLLGIIPQGTVNNLAKVLHIPLLVDLAIQNLLHGSARTLDVGVVNGAPMISTMTIGVLANAALAVTQQEKQRFGPAIFLAKGAEVLARHEHWHLTVAGGGHAWAKDTQFMLVTMTNSVGGFRNFAPQAKPDDGKFHVFIAPRLTWERSFLALPYFVTGNFAKIPGMTYFTAPELTITADKPLRSRIDGDPSARLPLNMKVVADHVQVIAPQFSWPFGGNEIKNSPDA